MNIFTLLQATTVAASTLGPAGTTPSVPFAITPEYKSDFVNSEQCVMNSPKGKVFLGEKAVYVLEKKRVAVLLDAYAERFWLDYCQ